MSATLLLVQALNGLQLGILLFLLAAGLTLVFGIMNFINLAHGSLYMMGAFIAATVFRHSGSFLLAAAAWWPAWRCSGCCWTESARLYPREHLDQVLATFGFILFFNELTRIIWGPAPISMGLPSWLSGTIDLLGVTYPLYRFLIIVAGLAVAAGCYALIHRTRLGMLIRAGSTDRMMVGALGVNIARLNTLLFVLGAVLAGVAGLMAGPILSAQTGMGEPILILTLVVIVIGGIGSVRGAFLAALMVGLVDTLGRALLPAPAARGAAAGGGQRGRPGDRLDADLCRHGAGAGAAAAGPVPRAARIGDLGMLRFSPARWLPVRCCWCWRWCRCMRSGRANLLLALFGRVLVYGIAALALNLLLGYGGMVSFGHALYLGLGAYAVGVLSHHGIENGWLHLAAALGACALVGLVSGYVALRTSGIAFIMITLAFAQMFYFLATGLEGYGGDDGMSLFAGSDFSLFRLDTPLALYYAAFGVLLLALAALHRLIHAPSAWRCAAARPMSGACARWATPRCATGWRPMCCRRCCAAWRACCWPI